MVREETGAARISLTLVSFAGQLTRRFSCQYHCCAYGLSAHGSQCMLWRPYAQHPSGHRCIRDLPYEHQRRSSRQDRDGAYAHRQWSQLTCSAMRDTHHSSAEWIYAHEEVGNRSYFSVRLRDVYQRIRGVEKGSVVISNVAIEIKAARIHGLVLFNSGISAILPDSSGEQLPIKPQQQQGEFRPRLNHLAVLSADQRPFQAGSVAFRCCPRDHPEVTAPLSQPGSSDKAECGIVLSHHDTRQRKHRILHFCSAPLPLKHTATTQATPPFCSVIQQSGSSPHSLLSSALGDDKEQLALWLYTYYIYICKHGQIRLVDAVSRWSCDSKIRL